MMTAIYYIFWWYGILNAWPVQLLFFKTKVFYEDKAHTSRKLKGGALIISNHFGVWDYIVNMFTVLPRKLNVVSSEIGFSNAFVRWGIKFFGGIQANRPTKSLRFVDDSVDCIKQGKLVQIFPEGRNTPDGKIHEFKPTYIMIALRAGAPIVPIVTNGEYGIRKKTRLLIGKKIDLRDMCDPDNVTREDIVRINDEIRQKMLDLKEQLDDLCRRENSKKEVK